MNIETLKLRVLDLGFLERDLDFGESKYPSEQYCLHKVEFGWDVFYAERGMKNSCKHFQSEDEACEYFVAWCSRVIERDPNFLKRRNKSP